MFKKKIKVLDLFSGIGGFSLGLHSTGLFETIKFVEKDPYCIKVLNKNFPNIPIEEDIKNVKGKEFEADVITGGFPCQPMSVAGNQKGTSDDRYLWPEMFRIIREVKPQFVIGENVQGIINIQDGMVLRQVQDDLESEGFEVQCFLIPASSIGAWHKRNRVWIVAHSEQNGYLNSEQRINEEKKKMEEEYRQNDSASRESSRTNSIRQTSNRHENISNSESQRTRSNNSRLWQRSSRISGGKSSDVSNTNITRSFKEHSATINRQNEGNGSIDESSSRRNRETKEDVSNTESIGTGGCRDIDQEEGRESCSSTQSDGTHANVSYTISQLSDGCSSTTRDSEAEQIRLECNEGWHWNQVRSEVERCSEQSKSTNQTWWKIESDLCGVPNGISRELDKDRASRIKSLGNAIVPQMARIFGLAIKKVLNK